MLLTLGAFGITTAGRIFSLKKKAKEENQEEQEQEQENLN
jgi:hypothetical protein